MKRNEKKQPESFLNKPGFDAAISAREHDYLNRWPFAQEIYGIATTGPYDWSVRVGVYGEWGTGKTSVLHFVRLKAEDDDQVVVSFNPWQFSSTNERWRDFVKTIFEEIEKQLGESQPGNPVVGGHGLEPVTATEKRRLRFELHRQLRREFRITETDFNKQR